MSNPLIGRTITSIKIADDKLALLFELAGEPLVVNVDAECCSSTWIESVIIPELPATVASVEDLDMPENYRDDHGDVIAFYGCKISTDKGAIVIDYRNSSNGYYGGSLTWPGERHYGGVYGQVNSKCRWVEVETK